jgi:putative aminopeptidase FrvX
MTALRRSGLGVLLVLLPAQPGAAQLPSLDSLSTRLAAMTAVSGYEQAMADSIRRLLPGSRLDRAGNVVLSLGSGEPKRLIACPLDEPGFVVGGIRADGYLTIRRAGPSPGPLADQQYEGQRVTLFGRKGAVPGVVGVRSTHLTRGRQTSDSPFTFDDAYVDIGADSAAQVARLGVDVLTPLARAKAPVRYGDGLLAAPVAARRTACAALLRAAGTAHPVLGTVVVAFVVEQSFTRRGLESVARTYGPFSAALLLESSSAEPVAARPAPADSMLPSLAVHGLRARYAGTPIETVSLGDAAALETALIARIGGAE